MKTGNKPDSFVVVLPAGTDESVRQWFLQKHSVGMLSEELIGLVYNNINVFEGCPVIEEQVPSSVDEVRLATDDPNKFHKLPDGGGFFESLYNWQESNNVLYQDKVRKKENKRMLSV